MASINHIAQANYISEDVVNIIAQVVSRKDILTCRRVCKTWKKLFSNKSLWSTLIPNDYSYIKLANPMQYSDPFKAYLDDKRIIYNIRNLNYEFEPFLPLEAFEEKVKFIKFINVWDNNLVVKTHGVYDVRYPKVKFDHCFLIKNDRSIIELETGNSKIMCLNEINHKLIAGTKNGALLEIKLEIKKDAKPLEIYSNSGESITNVIPFKNQYLITTRNFPKSNSQKISLLDTDGNLITSVQIYAEVIHSFNDNILQGAHHAFSFLNDNLNVDLTRETLEIDYKFKWERCAASIYPKGYSRLLSPLIKFMSYKDKLIVADALRARLFKDGSSKGELLSNNTLGTFTSQIISHYLVYFEEKTFIDNDGKETTDLFLTSYDFENPNSKKSSKFKGTVSANKNVSPKGSQRFIYNGTLTGTSEMVAIGPQIFYNDGFGISVLNFDI
ncbi:MAG: F-box protein [Parachlamydiales bacterium]|nr:F-box protein [Parachlamydiales bacterium]